MKQRKIKRTHFRHIMMLMLAFAYILGITACDQKNDEEFNGPPLIPENAVKKSSFSLYHGNIISSVDFYADGTYMDAAMNADFIFAGGEVSIKDVSHKGKTYTIPAYVKTSQQDQAMALDLSKYAEKEEFTDAFLEGYTIETTVQFTENPGNKTYGIFSSTQNGMFGFYAKNGRFIFQHFDTDYRDVKAKEKFEIEELYHLVGVYNAHDKKISLYINGELQGSTSVTKLDFGESPFIYVLGADVGYEHAITDYSNVPSIYTSACIYSGAMTDAEVQSTYENMIGRLSDPEILTRKPASDSQDYVMQNVKISGTAAAGNELVISGEFINNTDTDRTFKVALEHPLLMTDCEKDVQYIPVAAHRNSNFSFKLKINEGGSGLCRVRLLTDNNKTLCMENLRVVATGRGYHIGDAHTHSTLSDGKDTLKSNFEAVYNLGHSWIYTSDHNVEPQRKSFARSASKNLTDFVALVGNEITTNYGHMLEYNTDYRHPVGYTGGMWDIMAAIHLDTDGWQAIIDDIVDNGGLCYLAHPFYGSWVWPGIGNDPKNTQYYTGFTGIEVYNSDSHRTSNHIKDSPDYKATERAFELWDRYNLKNEKHYFGICNTDGHTKNIVGTAANAVLINELNEENIIQALKNGTFYGTNGPELRFSISGASNGQSLLLPENGKATLKIKAADQYSAIKKVVLYRYTIGSNVDKAYKDREVKVLYEDKKENKGLQLFEYSKKIDVAENEFYRVEVYTQQSLYGDPFGGFAFSNPVWIVK